MTITVPIYMADNVKRGGYVSGTADEIEEQIHVSQGYAAYLARTGKTTREGWKVRVIRTVERTLHGGAEPPKVYYARKPGEDPIIGCCKEIAALTGIPYSVILSAVHNGEKKCKGWTLRPATPSEIKVAEEQWGA